MFKSISVNYNLDRSTSVGSNWLNLEQEYKPKDSDSATIGDLSQMLNLGKAGQSAFRYITDVCPYAVVFGDVITISLDFYVWPSAIDLNYNLAADLGVISEGESLELARSFDVPLKGVDTVTLPYMFSGTLTPEMPFISSNGSLLTDVDITIDGSQLYSSAKTYCVLRAEGIVTGFKHTVEMAIHKDVEEKILNLNNSIVATWVDDEGESQEDILTLDIPPCVVDLLEECPDGTTVAWTGCFGRNCDGIDYFVVRYNTCTGSIISAQWETND